MLAPGCTREFAPMSSFFSLVALNENNLMSLLHSRHIEKMAKFAVNYMQRHQRQWYDIFE